jgi:hypothetical protein
MLTLADFVEEAEPDYDEETKRKLLKEMEDEFNKRAVIKVKIQSGDSITTEEINAACSTYGTVDRY